MFSRIKLRIKIDMRIKLSDKYDIFNRNKLQDGTFMKTTLDYSQFLISC